jgi:hypothetical protein
MKSSALASSVLSTLLLMGCEPAAEDLDGGSDPGRDAPAVDARGTDAPAIDAAGLDAPTTPDAGVPAGLVPIFIAQGKLGRITISCDDGQTWAYDHSEQPTGRCWTDSSPENVECDHHLWSSLGLAYGDGYFYASWGWGYPGTLRRSADGVTWEDILPGHTFAGIAFGNGYLVANDRPSYFSSNAGDTFEMGNDITSPVWNLRTIDFIQHGGGRFVASLSSGATDFILSDDHGLNWRAATTRPSACVGQVVYGNGVAINVHEGAVCRSTDGGDTWTEASVVSGGGTFSSPPYFFDGAFHVYAGATLYRSSDAMSWEAVPLTPTSMVIGAVAQSTATGSLVGIRTQWGSWYETQQFYRSDDGITWEVLPTTDFTQSHPITDVIFGYAEPSTVCP